jgi:glycosyltransferase involved in cell wall biosynthesis/acetyltransferase-like isoleucine patch superfamily enzyme
MSDPVNPWRPVRGLLSRGQTALFEWRLRLSARHAGARVHSWIRRSHPWKRRPAYRRIRSGCSIEFSGRGGELSLFVGGWLEIGADVTFVLRGGSLYLGDHCRIGPGSIIEVDGSVVIHEGAQLEAGSVVRSGGGDVEIGPSSRLGRYTTVESAPGLSTLIGRGASVGGGATVRPGAELGPGLALAERQVLDERLPAPPRRGPRGLRVSIVVSSKDRRAFLPGLLSALTKQTLSPDRFELVIVDNGSSDGTEAYLREVAPSLPFRTTVLRREPPGGPARGRNAGWNAARAPVIAFTDDDCLPSPEWLEEGLRIMGEGEPGIVQGRTLPDPRRTGYLGAFDSSQRIEWESSVYETCNILYPRAALEVAGGFSEDIPVPAGEDTEVAWRVKSLGYPSRFAPEAVVFHAVHSGHLRGYAKRFRQWAEVPRVLTRTPEVRKAWFLGVFWSRFHAWFLLAIAGLILSASLFAAGVGWWWAALLLCLPYGRFLVRAARETTPLLGRLARMPLWVMKDAIEVTTLLRGSVRYRRLLL